MALAKLLCRLNPSVPNRIGLVHPLVLGYYFDAGVGIPRRDTQESKTLR